MGNTPLFLVQKIQSSSGYVTKYPDIIQALDSFISDVRLILVAAKDGNTSILGGIAYDNFVLHGDAVIKECDRIIYKQPDEPPDILLRRSTSFLTEKLSLPIVLRPEDEELKTKIERYISLLDSEEILDLVFDNTELLQSLREFRHHAAILYESCLSQHGYDLDKHEHREHFEKLKKFAHRLREYLLRL